MATAVGDGLGAMRDVSDPVVVETERVLRKVLESRVRHAAAIREADKKMHGALAALRRGTLRVVSS